MVDIGLKEKIETYAPRILKEISEHQEKSDDKWKKQRLPKKLEVFEFNLEKAKEKKEQKKREEKKLQEWYDNPRNFLEATNLPDQYIPEEQKVIYNGLIIPIDHSEVIFSDIPAKCRILVGEYDFEKKYKSGKKYRFLKDGNKYYRFSTKYKDCLKIHLTNKIGICITREEGEQLQDTTKVTYLKHIPSD